MSSQLFYLPQVREFDTAGAVGSGYKLQFYLAGTSTPSAPYTDSALGTPHSNPVVADSAGVFAPIYLDSTIDYKIDLLDASDVSQSGYPVDNYLLSTITQSDIGDALWPRTTEETAAGVTPTAGKYHYAPGNILRYGADASGATSSYTAVVNAVAAHPDEVFIPIGTFDADGGARIEHTADLTIKGEGPGSILKSFLFQVNDSVLHLSDFKQIESSKFVYINSCTKVDIERVHVTGLTTGSTRAFTIFASDNGRITGCTFDGHNQYPIWLRQPDSSTLISGTDYGVSEHWAISDNYFYNADNVNNGYPAAINIANGVDITITGNLFDSWPARGGEQAYGIYNGDAGTIAPEDSTNITITGNTFQDCSSHCIGLHDASTVTISGNSSDDSGGLGHDFVKLFGDVSPNDGATKQHNITIVGNTLKGGTIRIGDGVDNGVISNNTIINCINNAIFLNGENSPDNAQNFVISGNLINDTGDSGIYCKKTERVSIVNNIIIDSNTDGNASGNIDTNACIRYSVCDDTLTTGNQFINTTTNAHYGISINTSAGKHKYDRSNSFVSMQTASLLGHYTAAPASGDWVDGEFVPFFEIDYTSNPAIIGWLYDGTTWQPQWVSNATFTVP